jgi:hypothetical protein
MKRGLWIVGILVACAAPASALTWEWRCDSDPTTLDFNGDGINDWIIRNGNPFDTTGLTGAGTWHATHKFDECVDNRPRNDYNTPTHVDLRWRSYAAGDWQATFWINADYSPTCSAGTPGYTFAPIYAHLELMPDNTQTMTLYNVYTSWVDQVLAQYQGLPNDFIDVHMDFDPGADTVSVSIGGVPQGTYPYGVFGPQNSDNFCTVLGENGEFDYVRIEVEEPLPPDIIPEPATLFLVGFGVVGVGLRLRRRRTA